MKRILKTEKVKKVLLSDKLYIPLKLFNSFPNELKVSILKPFSRVLRSRNFCDVYNRGIPCELIKEHGESFCSNKCENSKKVISTYKKTKKWVWIDRGDVSLIKNILKIISKYLNKTGYELEVIDRRIFFKLHNDLKLSIKWNKLKEPKKSLQKKVVSQWIEHKHGQLIAPPRFGKTAIGAMLSTKSGTRVLIMAQQKELLKQFYNTFVKFTDLEDRRRLTGKELVAINPKEHQIKNLAVALCTWQQFLNKKRLSVFRDKFGLVIVDEIQFGSADKYSEVISRFKAKFRCGLTATPKRRDKKEIRADRIVGPPVVSGGSEQLDCKYIVNRTAYFSKQYKQMTNRNWTNFWKGLTKDTHRNELIAKYILKDVKKGHKVVVPLKYVEHLFTLEEILRKKNNKLKIATFHGSIPNRDKIADNIHNGKYDVVLATSKMISVGFDAPPLSCLHVVFPIFDRHTFYQQYSRIRTKCENKPTPIIRLYIDEGSISEAFLKSATAEFKRRNFKEIENNGRKLTSL